MASQLLIEGVLDAKGPRGSEDRKFLKAWRKQWARFSVVHPSGRREPYLTLTLSHSSSEVPGKEIKLCRDNLRLFRCRSKSRPYRTWAITTGNKVVLYFAAKSEIQAQNWMQAVRDGLWPPCFSFQMLTACNYEVSLVDDDNTFMAGLLGVYGRFVMTSEEVISLMHPHWGSALLEISLDNIIDVLFIREAEISPAGVFSIILKRIEGSNVKALQFFCNTAKDAMQWILSKLYTRRKSFTSNGSKKPRENSVSFSDDFSSSSSTDLHKKLDNEKTVVSNNDQLISSQTNYLPNYINDPKTLTNSQPEYENIELLRMNTVQDEEIFTGSDKDKETSGLKSKIPQNIEKGLFLWQLKSDNSHDLPPDSESGDGNALQNFKSNENTHANVNGTISTVTENFKKTNTEDDLNSLNFEPIANETDRSLTKVSKSCAAINYEPQSQFNISDSHLYATVNKNVSNDSSITAKSTHFKNDSFGDHVNSNNNNQHLLPQLPSNFLDTSLNTLNSRSKTTGSSSSSEEENEHLLLLINEFDELKTNEEIYEEVSARKGTIYEEIDESEEECVSSTLNIPELPTRPTNLVIPESLRLQKLSKHIHHTLEVMDDAQSQKELRHPNFIKKIKDVNKIMRLSPNAKEPFTVESKLKIDTTEGQLLPPNALKTST